MRLTSRDLALIGAVYRFRVLRRAQIQQMLFPSKNTANQRLMLLHAHGYLARRRLPVEYGQGSGQALYLLGGRGASLLADRWGLDPAEIGWRRSQNHVSSLFLEHTLMVNEVRLAVELACQRDGHTIEAWLREDELRAAPDRVWIETDDGPSRQVTLVPDAYLRLIAGRRRASFFLEADRSTETGARWAAKVRAYLAYVRSGAYLRRYGSNCLRVLVVATSQRRMENLLRTTARVCDPRSRRLFWFTSLEQVAYDTVLAAPIWRLPATDESAPLLVREASPTPTPHPIPRLLFRT
jgi:hypothetical protein